MRNLILIVSIFFFSTCSKNDTESKGEPINTFNEIFQIHFDLDGKKYDLLINKDSINYGNSNLIQTSPDNYLIASGAFFRISQKSNYSLLLGSAQGDLLNNWSATYESFKMLMSPGEKKYDSLLYCYQTKFNRVEIKFSDENRSSWATTKWTDIGNYQIQKMVDQPGSSFVITEYKEASIGNKNPANKSRNNAAIIKGTFNCILYKANSSEKMLLTNGSFTLFVGLDG